MVESLEKVESGLDECGAGTRNQEGRRGCSVPMRGTAGGVVCEEVVCVSLVVERRLDFLDGSFGRLNRTGVGEMNEGESMFDESCCEFNVGSMEVAFG